MSTLQTPPDSRAGMPKASRHHSCGCALGFRARFPHWAPPLAPPSQYPLGCLRTITHPQCGITGLQFSLSSLLHPPDPVLGSSGCGQDQFSSLLKTVRKTVLGERQRRPPASYFTRHTASVHIRVKQNKTPTVCY